jgi:uncharacterized membrane protein
VSWSSSVVVAGAIAAAVNAGTFFAFSNFVMPALRDLPPADGASAMQSINRFAPNPLFVLTMVGAVLIGVPVMIWGSGSEVDLRRLGVAMALSILSILVTAVFNVPRNDALATLDAGSPSTEADWVRYVVEWTRWNTVRTVMSAASVGAYALSLRGR